MANSRGSNSSPGNDRFAVVVPLWLSWQETDAEGVPDWFLEFDESPMLI